jgi:ubiquinone/menaquinone biosynthesis C-methylase UbiE
LTYLATGFRDADGADEVDKLVRCLAFMNDLPCFRAYKERSIDALCLTGASRAIDLACGLGYDLLRMRRQAPRAALLGLDASGSLLAAAQDRVLRGSGIEVLRADARNTGLPDGAFDAVRIDRSLQHIERPQEAVGEMARLLKPGGRAVLCEPDWATFQVTGAPADGVERALAAWRASIANPRIGWHAAELAAQAGLEVFLVATDSLLSRSFAEADVVYDLQATLDRAEAGGALEAGAATEIRADMERRTGSGTFVAHLTVFTVGALKP